MDENSSGYKLRPVFGGSDAQKLTGIVGKTVGLGEFSMDFVTGNGNENQAHHTFHSQIDRLAKSFRNIFGNVINVSSFMTFTKIYQKLRENK